MRITNRKQLQHTRYPGSIHITNHDNQKCWHLRLGDGSWAQSEYGLDMRFAVSSAQETERCSTYGTYQHMLDFPDLKGFIGWARIDNGYHMFVAPTMDEALAEAKAAYEAAQCRQ